LIFFQNTVCTAMTRIQKEAEKTTFQLRNNLFT
jgi:hypothetical protein